MERFLGSTQTEWMLEHLKDYIDEGDEILYNLIKDGGGFTPPEESKFTTTEGTVQAVGGLPAGSTVTDMTAYDVLYKILFPYQKPTVTIGINPTTTIYGPNDSIGVLKISGNITKKTNEIQTVKFYFNGVLLDTKTDAQNGGVVSYVYTPDTAITMADGSSFVVKIEVFDGTSTVSAQTTISFVSNSYYGCIDDGVTIDETSIKTLTSVIKNSKNNTISYTTDYGRFVYAAPATFGAITSVKDNVNNLNYTASCTYEIIKIDGVDYNVVYLTDAMGFEDVKITFS